MDASKAFDRVCHWSLFDKLRFRNLPVLILRLIIFWYSSQLLYVKWGAFTSNSFHVCKCVRQGGVLSPVLFNVYMDQLSITLSSSNSGCSIGSYFYNHFFYADDLVLLSPSPKGLQKLVDLCCNFSTRLLLTPRKLLACRFYLNAAMSIARSPCILLNGHSLPFTSSCRYHGVYVNSSLNDDILRR